MSQPNPHGLTAPAMAIPVPAMIAGAGERARLRFIDFFTVDIRNPHTRAAYSIGVRSFFTWLEKQGLAELGDIRAHHVSAYTEMLTREKQALTVRQHLAAIRRLFDCLIVGRVVDQNPAAAARGPRHIVKKGRTPVLNGDEVRKLFDSIDVSTIIGLRDRALIALLIYSFARISAALRMNVEDYYPQGEHRCVRLHEKGSKEHEVPVHHLLKEYLDAYVTAAGITAENSAPLFRTLGGRGRQHLSGERMTPHDAYCLITRRARRAGIFTRIARHSFRATGITIYLLNGGLLKHAQGMAAHQSPHTTKLYDCRAGQITLEEVDKIVF
jgi:site-specific recombinase XerD